jgi:hypothetical protein
MSPVAAKPRSLEYSNVRNACEPLLHRAAPPLHRPASRPAMPPKADRTRPLYEEVHLVKWELRKSLGDKRGTDWWHPQPAQVGAHG